MTKPTSQQILIFDDFTDKAKDAILHGFNLASIFSREVTLVHLAPDGKKLSEDAVKEADDILDEKARLLEIQWNIPVRTQVYAGNIFKQIGDLIDENNGIVAVAPIHHEDKSRLFTAKNILKLFRNVRIPYVIVNSPPAADLYKKLILPVNYYIENKEKALWASYFGRFHAAEIRILHTSYKDKGYKILQENILKFVRQFFNDFSLNYEVYPLENIPVGIDRYALTYAKENNAGMIIVMTTLEYAFDDYLFGPPEKKILQEIAGIPVMFINPRKDLYCMCD